MTTRIKKQKGCSHPDCGCASCCCSPCVKDCYRIKDYTSAIWTDICETINGTEACLGGGDSTWDGSGFIPSVEGVCDSFDVPGTPTLTDEGHYMPGGGYTKIVQNGCDWVLSIYFDARIIDDDDCDYPQILWEGTKSGGSTPAGIYTRTGGCSAGPETIEIEECPGAGYAYPIASCYQIEGYTDGDLDCPSECCGDEYCASDQANATFDGTFVGDLDTCQEFTVNAPSQLLTGIGSCLINAEGGLRFDPTSCSYILDIKGQSESGFQIWLGTRTGAHEDYPDDPIAGIYTRIEGCDGTSSISIIPC